MYLVEILNITKCTFNLIILASLQIIAYNNDVEYIRMNSLRLFDMLGSNEYKWNDIYTISYLFMYTCIYNYNLQ